MSKLRKTLLIKSLVLVSIIAFSYLFIKLIIIDHNEYIDTISLIAACITLLSVLFNNKLVPYISSVGYLFTYLLCRNLHLNSVVWLFIYLIIILITYVIEKMFHVKHRG